VKGGQGVPKRDGGVNDGLHRQSDECGGVHSSASKAAEQSGVCGQVGQVQGAPCQCVSTRQGVRPCGSSADLEHVSVHCVSLARSS
jgi:hypothetical protein